MGPCGVAALILLSGCAQEDSWYETSKNMDAVRSSRIEAFKQQGMDQVRAERTADFESSVRNTEIGGRKFEPIQGEQLKDAINRSAE